MPTWMKERGRSYRCDLVGNTWLRVFRCADRWCMECFGTVSMFVDFVGFDYGLRQAKGHALSIVRERCQEIIKATEE